MHFHRKRRNGQHDGSRFSSVPVLLIPQQPCQEQLARRVAELGLGIHLRNSEASAHKLRDLTMLLIEEASTRDRVAQARAQMNADLRIPAAAKLIEEVLSV